MMARTKVADRGAIRRTDTRKAGAKPVGARLPAAGPGQRAAQVKGAGMPGFVGPQLAKAVSRPPSGEDWVHEIKFDGYRMQLRVENGEVTLRTRKGLDWTEKFPATVAAATALPDCMIDGEVVALDKSGSPHFSALQAALSQGRSENLVYLAFDLLYIDGEDWRLRPLSRRKGRLKELIDEHPSCGSGIRYVDHLTGSGDAILGSASKMQLEGIVSKRLSAPYRSGRTASWLKAKCRPGHEVVIGGWSGGTNNLRSLVAGVFRGDHLVYVGQVGTGFNARNAKGLLQRLLANATDKSPFAGKDAPRRERDWTWVTPVLVAEIEFAGWTDAGMLRAAAFKGLREDKPAKQVKAEQPASPDILDVTLSSPQTAMRTPSQNTGNVVLGTTITNPDKALWSAENGCDPVTKLDLARYLEGVGRWMIEHLKGRPCSVIRAPDGIYAQKFFQRHAMKGVPKLITLTKVAGDREAYMQIDSVEALIAMAQLASIEYHPWNCQPFCPAVPGRLVFDLDPAPDVAFDAVLEAAQELRHRLEQLGLAPFCKTTGGKGIHVVTPLKTKEDDGMGWEHAKRFSLAVCSAMANDSPDRYVLTMAKKQRTGRIFLDYLRNDRLSTAVAPLSPRLRPGAPVSMPLPWSQATKGLDPRRFTLRTAPALLRKSKAWKDYFQAERPLASAIRKLLSTR
jgi:bifunctional non-homologous end joining protein LigD